MEKNLDLVVMFENETVQTTIILCLYFITTVRKFSLFNVVQKFMLSHTNCKTYFLVK